MKPVYLTPAAEADLAAAIRWYEDQREGLGVKFAERVDEAIERIALNPQGYMQTIADARRINLRQFPYALWYRVRPDNSVVIACLHGKRDLRLAKERALGILKFPAR